MTLLHQDGFDFSFDSIACADCNGKCCKGDSGHVWINDYDVGKIGEFLELNKVDFILRFVNRVNNRLVLKERYGSSGYACIFFDEKENKCSVYPVRPEQCRSFPFWEFFKTHQEEVVKECPGIREIG